MIKLYDKQVDVIIECETISQACKYVSDNDLCVWDMNGDEWEVRPRREMFKGVHLIEGGV
nr:MAG TPA: hypothetical protein [Caudoviricetes sp.]